MPLEDIQLTKNKFIGSNQPCFIIAEIGQNHQGELSIAKELIRQAKTAGADCVKFQMTNLTSKFNKFALEQPYTSVNSFGTTYGDHKSYLEFSPNQMKQLAQLANELDLVWACTPMDPISLELLVDEFSDFLKFIKIGSGDANNFPLLIEAAKKGLPMFVSTGMQDITTVQKIYDLIQPINHQLVFLHCVSAYPIENIQSINLNVLRTYRELFPDVHIGYSGHESGSQPEIVIGSVALGAKVIERHITLDHYAKGSDHKCSLTPVQFKDMVRAVRCLELALGDGRKTLRECEMNCYLKLGKKLVAARDIFAGEVVREMDVKVKVALPQGGMDAGLFFEVIGKVLKLDVKCDEIITSLHF